MSLLTPSVIAAIDDLELAAHRPELLGRKRLDVAALEHDRALAFDQAQPRRSGKSSAKCRSDQQLPLRIRCVERGLNPVTSSLRAAPIRSYES